jgi:hypothetical protein
MFLLDTLDTAEGAACGPTGVIRAQAASDRISLGQLQVRLYLAFELTVESS